MPLLAYIDPGSGSMLLQVILAGILAVPFFFRRTIGDAWRKIRGEDDSSKSAVVPEETDNQR
ncbi:MAG TPA: hypothetical protein VFW95_02690 [Candidatus Limnocylindria bacterium]|nr:hypothetical protein [Candidatus Limnocylindria bacterium]